jgi:amino acid permease
VDRSLFLFVMVLLLLLPTPVFAYIDPGAGSMAYQVLLAGVMALSFTFRRSLSRLAAAIRHWRQSPPPGTPEDKVK